MEEFWNIWRDVYEFNNKSKEYQVIASAHYDKSIKHRSIKYWNDMIIQKKNVKMHLL